ncbi:MAG TPA: hypothetical protein DCF70_02450 [Treponema sp.]|nr:hypothetical protein [Treponema sp.]
MADTKKASGGSTIGLRIGAVILWIAALVMEFFAISTIMDTVSVGFIAALVEKVCDALKSTDGRLYVMVGLLVVDAVFVIIGAQLWKNANHINPASEKNKALFWLWNNMGVVVAAICFIPFIVLLLKNDKADKKTKAIGAVAAAILLAISGLASYDWNPVSKEDLAAQGVSTVFWTQYGTKYHTHDDCSAIKNSTTITSGTLDEAVTSKKEAECKICEKRDAKALAALEWDAHKAEQNAPAVQEEPAA